MPQFAKYRLISAQSIQTQPEVSPSKTKVIQKRKKKSERLCSYKLIKQEKSSNINMNNKYYDEYINAFVNNQAVKQDSPSNSLNDEQKIFQSSCNKDRSLTNLSLYFHQNSTLLQNKDVKQDVLDFLQKSKNNFYKNIVYAFSNHILYQTTEKQRINYEQLTSDSWSFCHIKLRVQQNLQNCGRFSLKVRNLLQNSNLSGIFVNFLQNCDQIWLGQSKIKDKESFKKQIQMILDAHQQNALIQNISYYKKQKKIINE